MKKAKKYRKHAEECRALARIAQNEEQRRQLLELAETWGSLALEQELTDGKLLRSPRGTGK